MARRIEIKEIRAMELDPSKYYLIAVDKRTLDVAEAGYLNEQVKKLGVKHCIVIVTEGSPDRALKIYQTPGKEGDGQRPV